MKIMNKTKVLYIVSTLRQCGPTTQLLGIVKNLNLEKFEPHVLTLSPEPKNSRKKDFIENGINVDSLNLNRKQFIFKGNKLLKNYVKNLEPEIIHTSGIRADTTVTQLKINIPHCMTIRNYVYEDYIAKFGRFVGQLASTKMLKAMNKCEYVIFCSETLKSKYKKFLNNEMYVIQNGVNTTKFSPVKNVDEKMKIRKTLNLPLQKKIYLSTGNLISRKDPLTLITAFQSSYAPQNGVLVMLGEGELLEQCKAIAGESVIIKGNVDNVEEYLKSSDVYISASKSEGLPNSVLEAASSGLSLILSNIPQHLEIFKSKNNFIKEFIVGDVNNLIQEINDSEKDNTYEPNNQLSNYINENFSESAMSKKYENLYLKMLNKEQRYY